MVIGTSIRDQWQARLSHLRRRLDRDADGPVWLWRIRIRILSFLVSRYGSTPIELPRPRRGRPVRASRPLSVGPPIEHPPRPLAEIRPIIDDLHAVNQHRRFVQEVGRPDLETVWSWYASTQHLRLHRR